MCYQSEEASIDPDYCLECAEGIDMDDVINECVSRKDEYERDDRDEDTER